MESGETAPWHYHPEQYEFIFFLEGSLTYFFKNRSVDVKKGDLLIIEPLEEHRTTNKSGPAVFFSVKIHGGINDTVWINELNKNCKKN